jgi:hypothetical protein
MSALLASSLIKLGLKLLTSNQKIFSREVLQNSCGAAKAVLECAVRRVLGSIADAIDPKMQRHSAFQDGFGWPLEFCRTSLGYQGAIFAKYFALMAAITSTN